MKILQTSCLLLVFLASPLLAATPSPQGAKVTIISPVDGETVTSPVTVIFGLQGMEVAPAGTDKDNTGHHHLIIDADTPDLQKIIPKDDKHKHFGGGQTQANIDLSSGNHTLQLVFGDKDHVPHNPAVVSKKITIHVK